MATAMAAPSAPGSGLAAGVVCRGGRLSLGLVVAFRPLYGAHGRAHAGQGVEVQQAGGRSEEHTSELQSQSNLVCRLLLEKKKNGEPTRRRPRWSSTFAASYTSSVSTRSS